MRLSKRVENLERLCQVLLEMERESIDMQKFLLESEKDSAERQKHLTDSVEILSRRQRMLAKDNEEIAHMQVDMLRSQRNMEEVMDILIGDGYKRNCKNADTPNLTDLIDTLGSYLDGVRTVADYAEYYEGTPWCERKPISSFSKREDMAS